MTYQDDKEMARSIQVKILAAVWDKRTFFGGVDAYVLSYRVWNVEWRRWDTFSEWMGGKTAAISQELMADIMPDADLGDEIQVDNLKLVIVEYSDIAGIWYVRQAE
jgi:hypothetical protein